MPTIITQYDACKKYRHDGTLDFDTAVIKAALITSAYIPDYTNHSTFSDLSANEVTAGNGYTTGGVTLSGGIVDTSKIDFNDISFTALTKTFRYICLYASGTYNGIVDPLIALILPDDTPADVVVSASTYTLILNASGLATL